MRSLAPEASEGNQLVELASGVDALYLSGRAALPSGLLERLEEVRGAAVESGSPERVEFGGQEVWVAPHAWGKYRYCLRHSHGQIGLTPSKALPPVRAQPRAEFLHGFGAAGAVVWFRELLESECGPVRLSVSRIDLHADFQGWRLNGDERHRFVCRAECLATFEAGSEFNGLVFGKRTSGTITARIYDKTVESAKSGSAYWPEIWGPLHDPDQPVLRVEFEVGRAALREYGLDAPEEVLAASGALWADLTSSWLSFRVPTADQTRARWPISREWETVRRATIADDAFGIERTYDGKRRGELELIARGLVGYVSSTAALTRSSTLEETLPRVAHLVRWYCGKSSLSFETRVAEKEREYLLP